MEESADVALKDDQVVCFQEQGFLQLGHFTTDRELVWLQTICDKIVEEKMEYTRDERSQTNSHFDSDPLLTILSPEKVIPELHSTLFYRNARKAFTRLLGVEETRFLTGWRIFLKPAHADETPWHQDAAYRPPPHDGAGVWMPLDPVTRENGCLQYISGSHVGDLHSHSLQDDNLVASNVDSTQAIVCALSPGEAVAHHCRTLHYAGPNKTDRTRRALAIVCQVRERR